eukprot:1579159-Rhodomonas_salina.1
MAPRSRGARRGTSVTARHRGLALGMPRARPAPAPGRPVCATRDGTRQTGNACSALWAPGVRTGSGR